MRISARADYAVRAAIELASSPGAPVRAETLAERQSIPLPFLAKILSELQSAGIVQSRRGAEGGHVLRRPADEITLAEILRIIDGPLADVHGTEPQEVELTGSATPMRLVWMAVRASLGKVLNETTLADVATDALPPHVVALAAELDPAIGVTAAP